MRGHIISSKSSKKRELNDRLKDIESVLLSLEEKYSSSLLQSHHKCNIPNQQVSKLFLKLSFPGFSPSQNVSTGQLRGELAKHAVHKIRPKSGTFGFGSEFYKAFVEKIVPLMPKMVNNSLRIGGSLVPTMRQIFV